MTIIAVSGGPDSMLLLDVNKSKRIIVAFVNYNIRKDSNIDQELVEKYCKDNCIKLEKLIVKKNPKGNFQSWARKIRYDFFKQIYDKHNASKLLLAHHKDDFLESALMQQDSKRTPNQFGMLKNNIIDDMHIERPFLKKYWKWQIMEIVNIRKIPFVIDSSNNKPLYTRNKIRIDLLKLSNKEKKARFDWFVMSNKILKKKNKKVDLLYDRWKKSNYSIKSFNVSPYKIEILFKWIHSVKKDINISSSKLESICDFIASNNGNSKYKIGAEIFIYKKNGRLFL